MDNSTSAEVAHLLIDIRNNLEWQSKMMRRNAFPYACEDPGDPPGRYDDLIDNQHVKTSFGDEMRLARERRKARKKDKIKIENRP